jgi:hypothetical protein
MKEVLYPNREDLMRKAPSSRSFFKIRSKWSSAPGTPNYPSHYHPFLLLLEYSTSIVFQSECVYSNLMQNDAFLQVFG